MLKQVFSAVSSPWSLRAKTLQHVPSMSKHFVKTAFLTNFGPCFGPQSTYFQDFYGILEGPAGSPQAQNQLKTLV